MAYIRAKKRNLKDGERTFYYVMQSYREDGKVRQETVAYLGAYDSVTVVIAKTIAHYLFWKRAAPKLEQFVGETESYFEAMPYTAERYASGRSTRWSRRGNLGKAQALIGARKRLAMLPEQMSELESKIARLRYAGELLGIDDPEQLVQPGTALYEQIEQAIDNGAFRYDMFLMDEISHDKHWNLRSAHKCIYVVNNVGTTGWHIEVAPPFGALTPQG